MTSDNMIFNGEDDDYIKKSEDKSGQESDKVPGQETDTDRGGSQNGESEVVARYNLSPLTLTVFKRTTGNGTVFYNTQIQRAYTQDDGKSFEYTSSLRPRDLRKAARLMEEAADDLQELDKQQVSN